MGLIFDDPQLAALTLTRVAAEEAQGPGPLTGRMHTILEDLMRRNGVDYLEELVIVLARDRFTALDDFARVTGTSTDELLDAVELEALDGLDDGS
jgi:hypothetical protein